MPVSQTSDVIPGFRREVDEICALLGYYVAYVDNSLLTFRDNKSVPSSRVNKFWWWNRYVVPKRW